MSKLTITSEQRDALYEGILDHLSGIGDLWIAVESGNLSRANRLGHEFSDDLRFVLDDLGFGEGTGATIELKTPPDVLSRVLSRLESQADAVHQTEAEERAADHPEDARNQLVRDTCRQLLRNLTRC